MELSNSQFDPQIKPTYEESSSNDQGKKQKTSYDNTRKTQIEWAIKLPWAKGVMGECKLWSLTFATFCIV